jgi:histidine triad (HIT) family protein
MTTTEETLASCLFCRIVRKEIPSKIVFENDKIIAFRDISPKAPIHILIVPKEHRAKLSECGPGDAGLLGEITAGVAEVGRQLELDDYRVVVNNGAGAGQVVFHLHFHLMAGRPFS